MKLLRVRTRDTADRLPILSQLSITAHPALKKHGRCSLSHKNVLYLPSEKLKCVLDISSVQVPMILNLYDTSWWVILLLINNKSNRYNMRTKDHKLMKWERRRIVHGNKKLIKEFTLPVIHLNKPEKKVIFSEHRNLFSLFIQTIIQSLSFKRLKQQIVCD